MHCRRVSAVRRGAGFKKGDTVSTYYWTPSVASRSCPRLALPTAAPQKLALTLIPTWMPTPALLQLGLSLLSNLRGHNLSTGVDRAAETPAPSTAHHDDAQAPAPAPHHALKLVTMKTPYGRSCYNSPRWVDTLHRPPHALDAQGVELVQSMLVYDPTKRLSAQCPVRNCGLMETVA